MDDLQRQLEEERLANVLELIQTQLQATDREIEDTRNQSAELAASLWEEGHHMIYDFDDVVEYQQYTTDLALHDNWLARNRLQRRTLLKMQQSPYFGRIDFAAHGRQSAPYYIGVHSLTAPGKFRPEVYDWRAPVSSMFYDYGIGPACYRSPSGQIHGDISLKRQYKIVDGRFAYMLDADVTIDDAILQRELSLHSESRLRTIISSIQREQNAAIRSGTAENLLVFGSAGSGKTSIGLHRLAWHLYQARGHISSGNILIFAQSDVFHSYIADIIPELGEKDVRRLSFSQLIQEQFAPRWQPLDACELAEHMLTTPREDLRIQGVCLKYSADFLDALREHVAGLRFAFDDIRVFGQTVCAGEHLSRRYAADAQRHRPYIRLTRLCAFVRDRLEDYFLRNTDEIKLKLLANMVDAKDVDGEYARLLQSTKDRADHRLRTAADLDAERIYLDFLQTYLNRRGSGGEMYRDTTERLDSGVLPFEDALVMLYIRLLTGELGERRTIRHVLIDEAQDFCLLQHRIIQGLTGDAKYTVLADEQQALFPVLNLQDQAQLRALYPGKVAELARSYRSTRQINDLAVQLLDKRRGDYFHREGAKPQVWFGADARAAIGKILALPACRQSGSIGILTKTAQQARALHTLLGRKDIALLDRSTAAFRPGALVLPVALAKGLEFDCVILPDCTAAAFHTPQDKRILYLMCTRALHHLFLLCPGELTPLLAEHGDLMDSMTTGI